MTRSKDRTEVETLKGKIRELQKENKQLKKLVGRADKRAQQYADWEESQQEPEEVVIETIQEHIKCPRCKANLKQNQIGNVRIIIECESCEFREVKKLK